MNGKRPCFVGGMRSSGTGLVSRPGAYQNGSHAPSAAVQRPRFPNIKDLQDQAASLEVNENTPVCLCTAMV